MACSLPKHLIKSLFVNSQLMDNLQCHLKSSEFWDMFVQLWPLFIPSVLVYVPAHEDGYHARCSTMFSAAQTTSKEVVWKTVGYLGLVDIILAL